MKKLYVFAILLSLTTLVFGQTYLTEDFSGSVMPPSGWSLDGLPGQWSISNTTNAGGTAPEAKFTYTSGVTVTRLVSPEVDLTGLTSIYFSFKRFYDWYANPAPKIGVATRSGGGNWNSVWEVTPTGNQGPGDISFEIDNDDIGASDFQFCIYLDGNMFNLDYVYLDNILLFQPLNLDAGIEDISTYFILEGPTPVTGTIKNFGTTQINSLEVNWQIDEGEITSTSFTGLEIDFGESYDYTCDGVIDLPIGSYNLKVWITSVNGDLDDNPENDMLQKSMGVASYSTSKTPCFEEFTSSTCAPCASFNAQFVPWCEQHEDEITLIKYQMNWPGSGDPYYTAEGGVRRNYYGVTWVPWLVGDGEFVNTNIAAVNAKFNESIASPAYVDIVSSHSLEGTVMTINSTVLSFVNLMNFKVTINVFEYLTTGNVGNNGETEFEHVMMKMVPDANGTDTDLIDRTPFTIQESVDLANTNVEEWEDLGVMVIVQDNADQVVFQSRYSLEDMEYATDASLTMLTYDGMEVSGFSPDLYEYTIVLPMGSTEVPIVEGTLSDENGIAVVVPTQELPGATTVDVFAEDRATKSTYTINFEVNTTGIGPEVTRAINVYPNPTSGKVFISGAENATIEIYNLTGAIVASYSDFSNNVIDLSNMEQGIYFLNIVIDNKTVLNKKVSLLK